MIAYRHIPFEMVPCPIMTRSDSPSKTIGELIDEIERIREDLLRLQRELEKMEKFQDDVSVDERKEA
jgi:hypothetical protein